MTMQAFVGDGPFIPGKFWLQGADNPTDVDTSLNVASKAIHMIGQLSLPARTGSKTLSTGKIHWMTGATCTFADTTGSGTTFTVGIQDVTASSQPARGDGTFDVKKVLTAGTDTLTASTWISTTMNTGTKTISHGDHIAVVFEMTTRGAAATDNVQVKQCTAYSSGGSGYTHRPCTTTFTSPSTYTASSIVPMCLIEFDDGTLGTLTGTFIASVATAAGFATNQLFNSGSTPDEYAMTFQVPFVCKTDGVEVVINQNAASATYEVILYSDPEGTPSVIETISVTTNMAQQQTVYKSIFLNWASEHSLSANTKYCVAVRPTTANSVGIRYFTVNTASHMGAHSMGTNCYLSTRTNQTGAFTATTTQRPFMAIRLSAFDDGTAVGGSGGGMRMVGVGGLVA